MGKEMESGKKSRLPKIFSTIIAVVGPDDPDWPPVTEEQVDSIKNWIDKYWEKEIEVISVINFRNFVTGHITAEDMLNKENGYIFSVPVYFTEKK